MANGGKRVSIMMAEKSSTGLSDGHGQFHDKSRRRKSVASHMAHPIAGETMKERQVIKQ